MQTENLDLDIYKFDAIQENDEFKNKNLDFSSNMTKSGPSEEENIDLNDINSGFQNEDLSANYPDEEHIMSNANSTIPDMNYNEQSRDTNEENGSVSSYVGSDLTPEEEERKKKVLLFKLKRFQKKGYTLSRPYNLDSDLIDVQAEVESIKREANLGASVDTMKKGLVVSTYLFEMLNTRFDPINAKLDGWSNQVKDDVDHGDYDEVFEELYDKYTDSLEMPPEIKLLSMLGTSALQFHIAQMIVNRTLDKSETTEILNKNPQIKKDILNAVNKSKAGKKISDMSKEYNMNQINMKQPMKQPSDIDDILAELEIEDENSKLKNEEILSEPALSVNF